MKGYVVTLMNLPESVGVAERCKESGKQFGVEVELFPAIWKDDALVELEKEGLKMSKQDESFSNNGAVVENYITQYRILKTILESNEPDIVLEQAAVLLTLVAALEATDT